jgi:hypothetical protein
VDQQLVTEARHGTRPDDKLQPSVLQKEVFEITNATAQGSFHYRTNVGDTNKVMCFLFPAKKASDDDAIIYFHGPGF